ncbi:uncharacterized protein AMSG_07686 [Thecamonas trahens ATCC 50062]|uniref:F-box domain-containing protein n=1 Tax=Thecamonas trahens ATCC 50062 TaxID=461836 RepID=A0A0L0DGM6_THETB|nr:hypothetical protein AMSG_07686 [Thecamonas trahens ATCC 50062]KNC51489.1 hypothetical protein AMSG_07686 [Thecamonas trahens ATCC 50062]|eukprot:XP_013756147.1 hypothetical protein AMSG_07686 [Thecamonas trahens ATCC 50062]
MALLDSLAAPSGWHPSLANEPGDGGGESDALGPAAVIVVRSNDPNSTMDQKWISPACAMVVGKSRGCVALMAGHDAMRMAKVLALGKPLDDLPPADPAEMWLVSLPDELLLAICSYLDQPSRLALMQTCGQMQRVCGDASLWRTLTLTHPNQGDWELLDLLTQLPASARTGVTKLYFAQTWITALGLLCSLLACPNVTDVDVSALRNRQEQMPLILYLLRHYAPRLTHFDAVGACDITRSITLTSPLKHMLRKRLTGGWELVSTGMLHPGTFAFLPSPTALRLVYIKAIEPMPGMHMHPRWRVDRVILRLSDPYGRAPAAYAQSIILPSKMWEVVVPTVEADANDPTRTRITWSESSIVVSSTFVSADPVDTDESTSSPRYNAM